MRNYTVTVPSGGSVVIGVVGDFVRLASAPGVVRFEAIDNHEVFELDIGDAAVVTPFDQLVLSGVVGVVRFQVGNGTRFLSSRVGGNVSGSVNIAAEMPAAWALDEADADVDNITAVDLFTTNPNRRSLLIQNQSATGDLWVRFGGTPSVGFGIKVAPGATLLLDKAVPLDAVKVIGSVNPVHVYAVSA